MYKPKDDPSFLMAQFEENFEADKIEMALFDMKDINRENRKIEMKDNKMEKDRKKTYGQKI